MPTRKTARAPAQTRARRRLRLLSGEKGDSTLNSPAFEPSSENDTHYNKSGLDENYDKSGFDTHYDKSGLDEHYYK